MEIFDRLTTSLSPAQPTLKQRVLGAAGWSLAGHVVSQAIRLGGNLIMTRLLVPEMFGVMAIASMVTFILALLADIGLDQKMIQSQRGDDPAFLDTAWVVQILRAVIIWLVALLISLSLYLANAAGMFAAKSAYEAPVLPLVIAMSSLSVIIFGFRSTRMVSAHRSFKQGQLIQLGLIAQLSGLVVMLVVGLLTRSIWALVAGGLVVSLTATALSHAWMRGHRNRFRCERNALAELMSFGKWILISSAVGGLAMNGDRLLLAGFVDAEVFGLYAIALLVVGTVEGAMGAILTAVSLPALSEIARNHPSRLREVYYKLRVPTDLLMLFAAGFLFAAGQVLIDLLYDPRYSTAGGMMQVLALSLIVARYAVAHQVYLAVGMPRYLTVINAVRFVSIYALLPFLYYVAGTQAAIWGIALHGLATLPFIYGFNARLKLNDIHREVVVLLALPVGFFCGFILTALLG